VVRVATRTEGVARQLTTKHECDARQGRVAGELPAVTQPQCRVRRLARAEHE